MEHRKVAGNYGYLRIPVLSGGLVQEASKALPKLLSTSGLILDLRSVSGGEMEAMSTVAPPLAFDSCCRPIIVKIPEKL